MKMGKRIFATVLAVMLILTGIPLTGFVGLGEELLTIANAATSGDYEYKVLEDGTAEITDYTGEGGDVVVPDTIDGHTVTTIGDNAFIWCSALTAIEIPDSVTTIGNWAFEYCDALTTIEIPDSVTTIGAGAFNDCDALTSVEIPDSVRSIGPVAFSGTAYYKQESNWENGVLYIGNHCIDAKPDEIPDEYSIREGTITIGDWAFLDCYDLTAITVAEENPNYSSDAYGVLYNKDKTTLIQYPIGNSRTAYTIPDSVTNIGDSAFEDCDALTTVEIPDSVTTIGYSAFAYCDALTTVEIPDSVTTIALGAFCGCSALTSIEIPDSVTTIRVWAFRYCDALTTVYYAGSEEQWETIDIGGDNGSLTNADIYFNYTDNNSESTSPPSTDDIENNIAIDTGLTGAVPSHTTTELLSSIGIPLHENCSMESTYSSTSTGISSDYLGAYSAFYEDVNQDGQREMVAVCVSQDSTTAYQKFQLVAFYSQNDIIYAKAYDTDISVTSTGMSLLFDVYTANSYIYITGIYASGIEGSGSNSGERHAVYDFSNLNWNCLVKFNSGVSRGNTEFTDFINDITLSATWPDEERLNEITSLVEEQMRIIQRDCMITEESRIQLLTSDFYIKTNSRSTWDIESFYSDQESYFQIYSTNATNSVPVGEQMTFWIREYYNASIVNDLDSCVISFAPEGIYQVTGTSVQNLGENNDVYYGVTVQAETAGSTLMTISDPNTGVYISVALTATDAMNVWRFNTVPVDTRYEENVNTNFYNYNRLCIANFDYTLVNEQPSEGEAKYRVAMDAYNANFHYAAVVAYDKNGEIYDTALIAPHKENETTLIENAGELLYLIGDTYHLIQNEYYYTGWSISTYTRAEVDVPEDGYIVITNNSSNPVVYTANLVDIAINFAFTSAKVVSGMVSSTNTSDAVSSIIREILVKAAEEGGWGFIEAFVQNALKTPITTETVHILLENFSNYLHEVDIDFSAIVADTLNAKFFLTLPETILYNVIPFGRVISLLFSSLDVANFTSEVIAYCNSFEAPKIYIYQPLNDDKAYVTNGVNVIPENGVEEGYVAHSFIVGEDDTIILNAQTALDAISKNRVVYDVTLYQGGTATQPDGKIKVMLPIPEGFNRDRLTVYWVKESGELQSMHCYLEGNFICFETDHLSYYAIFELNADSPSDIEPATSETNPPVTDIPVTDPSTEPSTDPTEPSEPEYVLGDVNGDGRITSADARLALRAAVNLEALTEMQRIAADVDKDNNVRSADARMILRTAVGLESLSDKED